MERRHVNGFCLQHCPSWTCFMCILVVATWNIMNLKLTAVRAQGLSPPPPLSPLAALFSTRRRRAALLSKHRYDTSLILHASIAEITAQLLSLSYVYLILSDDDSIIRIYLQINILEGRAGYVGLIVSVTISYSFRCLTTVYCFRTVLLRI